MKTFKTVLITGIFISLASPSQAQIKTTQVDALVEALRLAAPPNKPNDGMYPTFSRLNRKNVILI